MSKRKIYVASSWRNEYYPEVVAKLREAGHDVYDFRNPPSGDPGFKWSGVRLTIWIGVRLNTGIC